MEGMPTIPGKDPEIMSSGEIAIAKRREKLNDLLQHGDPFTGRFLCDFQTIAHYAKEIIETDGRISRPWLKNGISGSKILGNTLPLREDFSVIALIREVLNERMEKYRIGQSLWEFTYSFESFEEMIKEVLEVIVEHVQTKEVEANPAYVSESAKALRPVQLDACPMCGRKLTEDHDAEV